MSNRDDLWSRRRFVATAATATGLTAIPRLCAWGDEGWNSGVVAHLLPTANHERFAIKASFIEPLDASPVLQVGDRRTRGRPTDSANQYFSFDIDGLEPDVEYPLKLTDSAGGPLCDSWPLRTFPGPDAAPERVRLVAYTCAGGHPDDNDWFLPLDVRRRLLRRALSFEPQAVIAIGDHIYYDQRTELENRGEEYGRSQRAFYEQVGWLDRTQPAFGTNNETSLKAAIGPQIGQLYGTLLRSTPSFFVSDDHDYFENDDADQNMVTFPPDHYQLEFARFSRNIFLPEFLPDPYRPIAMPGTGAGDRAPGISEAFGTLRYGRLVEALIYDCARYLSLKDGNAGLIPPEAEHWLHERTRDQSVAQLLHVPSHPFGWSAGKWREWYPDVLDIEGGTRPGADVGNAVVGLTTDREKYLWQSGWWQQHQRLLAGLGAQRNRPAVVLSGDLHAIGHSTIERSRELDLTNNPVHTVLTGTLGTRNGWPSDYRGTPPLPAIGLRHEDHGEVFEKNGFTVLDIEPDVITVRLFAWKTGEPEGNIDSLAPYHTYTIRR
ncbi:MAG: hypothetical protein OEM63_03000 [Gammaproteobacteria bacterium]|nr:hypothetical protein [Gammaproteobacteria bacterium]